MSDILNTSREIFDFFKDGALPVLLLKDFSVLLFNDAASTLFKWQQGNRNFTLRDCSKTDEQYNELVTTIKDGIKTYGFFKYTGELVNSKGQILSFYAFGSKIHDDPSILLILFIDMDGNEARYFIEEGRRYRQLLDSLPVGLAIHRENKIVFANTTAVRLVFADESLSEQECYDKVNEMVGTSIWDFIHPDFRGLSSRRIDQVLGNGYSVPPVKIKYLSFPGRVLEVESTILPIEYMGKPSLLTVFRKVSEENILRFRLKELNDCFFSFTSDPLTNINKLVALCGRLLSGKSAFYNGLCKGQLISWGQWNPPDNWNSVRDPEGKICSDLLSRDSEKVFSYNNLQTSSFVTTDETITKYNIQSYLGKAVKINGSIAGVVCVVFEENREFDDLEKDLLKAISAALAIEEKRRLAENELKISEERYRTLVELSPYVTLIVDVNGNIVYINESTLTVFEAESSSDILGHNIEEFISSKDLKDIHKKISDQPQDNIKLKCSSIPLRKVNGDEFTTEGYISSISFQGERAFQVILVDLTDRLQIEEQQRLTNKAETISILAGSVAHDLKNLLSPILTATSMLLEQKKPGDILSLEDFNLFKNSEAAVVKATDLAKRLLQTARKQPMVFEPVDLNALISETVQTYKTSFGTNIKVSYSLDPDIPPFLYLDSRQIEQVLLNLAFNSRDAMPNGGLLSFVTEQITIQPSDVEKHKFYKIGKFVKLTVTDTGSGMKPELLEKIFDPFFTTKGQQGSGLGLSTTLGIIKNHGGWITVKSKENIGTTFNVFLPLTTPTVDEDGAKIIKKLFTGNETILLVDDSEEIIQSGTNILSSLGYTVITASDGIDALEIVRDRKVDLVVADLIMPIKGGKELLDDLTEEGFHIPILLISGYDAGKKYRHSPGGFAAFLEKPFHANQLAETIRNVLDCCSLENRG